MKDYIFVSDHNQVILSNTQPDAIEKEIIELLSKNEIEYTSDEKKYKMTYTWTNTDDKWKGYDASITVKITITKVNSNTCAIEFMKVKGN
jgi:hypothetical protein|tara:strand:+ start:375 stop:644 length:270 start_codon:yes stop_codon:yes gene_type:complete